MRPPSELQQLTLIFLATFPFFVATLLNNDRLLVVTAHEVHLYGPFTQPFLVWPYLYANVYGLLLPIRPFQGPLYTVIGPFYPRAPRRSEGSGWYAPALGTVRIIAVGLGTSKHWQLKNSNEKCTWDWIAISKSYECGAFSPGCRVFGDQRTGWLEVRGGSWEHSLTCAGPGWILNSSSCEPTAYQPSCGPAASAYSNSGVTA